MLVQKNSLERTWLSYRNLPEMTAVDFASLLTAVKPVYAISAY